MTDKTNTASASGGVGFCGLLTIVFIALKLTGVIGWSWWWVLSPLWLPLAVVLGIAVIGFLIWFVVEMAKSRKGR